MKKITKAEVKRAYESNSKVEAVRTGNWEREEKLIVMCRDLMREECYTKKEIVEDVYENAKKAIEMSDVKFFI